MEHKNHRKVFIDVPLKEAEGLGVGDKVTMTVQGEVCEVRSKEDYELYPCGCPSETKKAEKDKKKEPKMASIGIKVKSESINEADYSSKMDDADTD